MTTQRLPGTKNGGLHFPTFTSLNIFSLIIKFNQRLTGYLKELQTSYNWKLRELQSPYKRDNTKPSGER